MVISMRQAKAPALLKGMPDLPAQPTTYLVFIATKHMNTCRRPSASQVAQRPEGLTLPQRRETHARCSFVGNHVPTCPVASAKKKCWDAACALPTVKS